MGADPLILHSEPAPCDSCLRAPRCAAELLACTAFVRFAGGASETAWRAAPKTDATRERYMLAFDPVAAKIASARKHAHKSLSPARG